MSEHSLAHSDSASTAAVLDARGLSRRYGELVALAPMDLQVSRGEVLGLLGTNGAGKTTTLSMLAGVLAPSAGTLRIQGHDVARDALAARAAVGYLPEDPALYRELRVQEHLRLAGELRGLRGARLDAAVDRVMQRCDLGEVRRRLVGNLSQGYRRRVGIAIAAIHEPTLLILDEPTVGLDPLQISQVRELVQDLGRERAIILSSHILPEVQAVCDRVRILHRGQVMYDGAVSGEPVLEVEFAHPPADARLLALPGVSGVSRDGPRIRLALSGQADPRQALMEAALREGWSLLSLVRCRDDLEHRFTAVIAGEPPEAAP